MLKTYLAIFLIPIIAAVAFYPAAASASAGVGIAPGKLHFEDTQQGLTQLLHVINTGTQRSSYEIFTEGDYHDWFHIQPSKFTLEPKQNKEVIITANYPADTTSEHTTRISVTAFAQSADDQVGTGVKIPTQISIDSEDLRNETKIQAPSHIAEVSDAIPKTVSASEGATAIHLWIYIPSIIAALLATVMVTILYRRRHFA